MSNLQTVSIRETQIAELREVLRKMQIQLNEIDRGLLSLAGSGKVASNISTDAGNADTWPDRYFERTAGAFADIPFERPPQPPVQTRSEW